VPLCLLATWWHPSDNSCPSVFPEAVKPGLRKYPSIVGLKSMTTDRFDSLRGLLRYLEGLHIDGLDDPIKALTKVIEDAKITDEQYKMKLRDVRTLTKFES
jgi:hypothetical protein